MHPRDNGLQEGYKRWKKLGKKLIFQNAKLTLRIH